MSCIGALGDVVLYRPKNRLIEVVLLFNVNEGIIDEVRCFERSNEIKIQLLIYKRGQSKIEALKEWETVIEEAQAEAEALKDAIKAEMLKRNTEELEAGAYIIRWTSVLSNRFDSSAFKKEHSELYKQFTKQVASKRFSIA